jgi:protein SCO1/2
MTLARILRLACGCGLALCATAATATLDVESAQRASRAAIGSTPQPFAFTTVEGTRVTLADYRGKPLIVSFVYTGCSQVCPTTTRFLVKAVKEARKVVGEDAFRVASIGFNIPADNPVSMKLFAKQNGVDDPRWAFLTPDAGMPEALARDFGFTYAAQSGGYDHLMQVTVLDGRGRVYRQVYGESFALPMLIQPLRELALGEPVQEGLGGWMDRVRLVCTVYDPLSGEYRLDWRLFIEIAVGVSCLALTLGFVVTGWRRARRAQP